MTTLTQDFNFPVLLLNFCLETRKILEHGGKLIAASLKYGIPLDQWIDLSTGVSPVSYPVPVLDQDIWRRLPEEQDGLHEAAAAYYGADSLLPVNGSQAAIKALPALRAKSVVGILHPSYNEHSHAWLQSRHEVIMIAHDELEAAAERVDVLVVCNPNNPTAEFVSSHLLKSCLHKLTERGGWLVVDEAFIDYNPSESMTKHADLPGLIVLRSLGKFFGLAGARVGFVFAEPSLLSSLSEYLGPWTVSGPSRKVALLALLDTEWQVNQRQFLRKSSERLSMTLRRSGLIPTGSSAYFSWVVRNDADTIHGKLAERGILTRCFADPPSVRFGLPLLELEWTRLESALVFCINDGVKTRATRPSAFVG